MKTSRLPDTPRRPRPSSERAAPPRRPHRLALSLLLLLALITCQASVAVEVRHGTCPRPGSGLETVPAVEEEKGPCYSAQLPGAGWWRIEVTVKVDSPRHRWLKRARLLEARFELLLAIDQPGTYRLCTGALPPGAAVAPTSAWLPILPKEGDPEEIELEPDPLLVALTPCVPAAKEGDPEEIELEPDP